MKIMHKYANHRSSKARSQNGQALLEGTSTVVFIMIAAVGSLLFLLNLGMSIYYKQKVGFILNQVAAAEADALSWSGSYNNIPVSGLESDAKSRLRELLKQAKMDGTLDVKVRQQAYTVVVDATVSGLPLFGKGTFLPNVIAVKDTASAEISDSRPPGILTLSVTGSPKDSLMLPCYGRFVPPYSNGAVSANTKLPQPDIAVFRAPRTPQAGYGQFVLSLPKGNPTNQSPPPQEDQAIFAGGWTSQPKSMLQ